MGQSGFVVDDRQLACLEVLCGRKGYKEQRMGLGIGGKRAVYFRRCSSDWGSATLR
jgi:hypothetical protein